MLLTLVLVVLAHMAGQHRLESAADRARLRTADLANPLWLEARAHAPSEMWICVLGAAVDIS